MAGNKALAMEVMLLREALRQTQALLEALDSTTSETIKELHVENEALRTAYANQHIRLTKPPAVDCQSCPLLPLRPPAKEEP